MNPELHFVDACQEEHFVAMSLIHALGWRSTYVGHVPDDYMSQVITDDRWVNFFREDYKTGRCQGLILYRGETPVACLNYGPARTQDPAYRGFGEIISLYTHPDRRSQNYGGLLIEEAMLRLRAAGHPSCYVLVLRENQGARRFYAAHGLTWDGTSEDILFPHDVICVDLRYVRDL